MVEEHQPPLLLQYLFGEAAGTAHHAASPRLLAWSAAFDAWIAEHEPVRSPKTIIKWKRTWRRLLRERDALPWQLQESDIQAHAAWMESEAYTPSTIDSELCIISNFYNWCAGRQVDPQCEPGFNPAAGVKVPAVRSFSTTRLLSKGDLGRLLAVLQR